MWFPTLALYCIPWKTIFVSWHTLVHSCEFTNVNYVEVHSESSVVFDVSVKCISVWPLVLSVMESECRGTMKLRRPKNKDERG